MPSPMMNIVSKEDKEILRDPRLFLSMVIVPLIIFPVMGMSMSSVISATEKELEGMEFSLAMVDNDDGNFSHLLFDYLNSVENMTVERLDANTTEEEAIQHALDNDMNAILFIPPNFTTDLEAEKKVNISVYSVMESISIVEGIKDEYLIYLLHDYEYYAISGLGYNSTFLLDSIGLEQNTIFEGRAVPYSSGELQGFFMAQSITIPMVLMMLIMMSAQLAAVTVASEKEEKTLETLLTLPVSRTTILMGKISGVALMTMAGAVAYMGGFMYYMRSLSGMGGGGGINAEELGLSISPMAVGVLALSIILALLAALSIAVLLAAFTEDVRSAQSLTGIIAIPVLIPAFVLMMGDMSILPGSIKVLIYAIPFSYPMLAAKDLFTGVGSTMFLGLIYQLVFTLAMFYAAGRLFSTEKIFTSKLEFKRKKR